MSLATLQPTGAAPPVDVSDVAPSSYIINIARPAPGQQLGIKVDDTCVISKIVQGGAVALDGRLRVGDKILSLNGIVLTAGGTSLADALLQSIDADEASILRFQVTHPAHGGSTSEKIAAMVLQRKAQQQEQKLAAERAKAAKKREALAARENAEASVAATAAAALRTALRAQGTYKMPEMEKVLEKLEARASGSSIPSGGSGGAMMAKGTPRKRVTSAQRGHKVIAKEAADAAAAAAASAASEAAAATSRSGAAIFVHFIPPPLRVEGKRDLPWIVHTTDGSGCHEARHVSFHSISGFSTFEGLPPEVAEGGGCSCGANIANHHLRGFGRLRWEAQCHAIVEDEDSVLAMADGRTYLAKSKRLEKEVRELQQRLSFVAG